MSNKGLGKTDGSQIFMDLLAKALSVYSSYSDLDNDRIGSIPTFQKISSSVTNYLDSIWEQDENSFLKNLEKYICRIQKTADNKKYIMIKDVCLWMDQHILHDVEDSERGISLWKLTHGGETPRICGALNSNYDDTSIWINPKYSVRPSLDIDNTQEEKSVANKNVFHGLNGELTNISYFVKDELQDYEIVNVILERNHWERKEKENSNLCIGFSPLSDDKEVIKVKKYTKIERNGKIYKGFVPELTYSTKKMKTRMKNDLTMAAELGVDVFFMPEMLGTSELCGSEQNSIEWIQEEYNKVMDDMKFPYVIILPSLWSNNSNSATVVMYDGTVLGEQKKNEPFLYSKGNRDSMDYEEILEALDESKTKKYVILHVPGVHRIAILICSEFLLENRVKWSELLCAQLGVTLIIVPSFSPGEQDFINIIDSLEKYDTSVIWGNCCGAILSRAKGIGGCALSGTKEKHVFGEEHEPCNRCQYRENCEYREKCKNCELCKRREQCISCKYDELCCENSCENISSCVFTIDLPYKQPIYKVSNNNKLVVKHRGKKTHNKKQMRRLSYEKK